MSVEMPGEVWRSHEVEGFGDVERWYTVQEAAFLCHRAEGTIRNLLSKHALPRRLVRGPGRNPRRIALLSSATVRALQRLTLRS